MSDGGLEDLLIYLLTCRVDAHRGGQGGCWEAEKSPEKLRKRHLLKVNQCQDAECGSGYLLTPFSPTASEGARNLSLLLSSLSTPLRLCKTRLMNSLLLTSAGFTGHIQWLRRRRD